jgi:hypothetical protein
MVYGKKLVLWMPYSMVRALNMNHLRLLFLFALTTGPSITTTLTAQGIDQSAFRAAFDPYLGVWQGEYRIYSQNDELLNQFKVNRNYWWDGDVMMGRVSYDFGGVKKTYFHRILLSQGTPFSFVTDRIDADEIRSALSGEILKGTVVWTRVLPREGLPVRISERINVEDDNPFIEFWGNQEALDASGRSMLVRIEGFLSFMADSRDFVTATDPESDPSAMDQGFDSELFEPEAEVVDEPEFSEPEPMLPEPRRTDPVEQDRSEPDSKLQEELGFLNVIGINEENQTIIVDYFLLYGVGDRIGTSKACFFAGMDSDFLYFEDSRDNRYRVPRKDKEARFQN